MIFPDYRERVALIGMTRSGKTTLARELLRRAPQPNVYVYDTKGTIRWPGYARYTTLRKVHGSRDARVIYAPNHAELYDKKFWDAFFKFVYFKRNCLVYVDEVYSVTDGQELPRHYHACLTRGGELGVSVFSGTQRPMNVPNVIFSESEHFYVFRLNLEGDREKVEDTIGIEAEKIKKLKKRIFYYANLDGKSGPYRLKFT